MFQSFQPIFFNWYLSNEKTAFLISGELNLLSFFIEKISFSFKLFSGHFYEQSFIKTVRCQIVQLDQKKKLVVLKHVVSMVINKAILKNWVYLQNTHRSPATHSMIQNLVQNLCYVVVLLPEWPICKLF